MKKSIRKVRVNLALLFLRVKNIAYYRKGDVIIMKTINKYEIKREDIMRKIENRKRYLVELTEDLNDWNTSVDMIDVILSQINSTRFDIKLMETKLKVMNVMQGFKTKVTA